MTDEDEIRIRAAGPDDIDVLWMALGQNPSDVEGESEGVSDDRPHEYRHYVKGWMRPGDAGVIAEVDATGEGDRGRLVPDLISAHEGPTFGLWA